MRCIRCLNGVELPDMTAPGQGKPAKPLVVKVDDKTRAFLEDFEQALGRSEVCYAMGGANH
jgi:RNA-binding protein 25